MKNDKTSKFLIVLEQVLESLQDVPGGLQRPSEGLSRSFHAWSQALENFEKVHRRVLRTNVDGAPSTAPSKLSSRDGRGSK